MEVPTNCIQHAPSWKFNDNSSWSFKTSQTKLADQQSQIIAASKPNKQQVTEKKSQIKSCAEFGIIKCSILSYSKWKSTERNAITLRC